ncbi:dipeptide ABC transporter ATP-binding protein [Niallia taxi]|uniref:Dipeptide ABC transporter ATP-binding protein n=3 Tax=Bacillaceae TaxID=186817 RepID=A0A437K4I9_9BACI|nr:MULTISPECIES: dipeptide ABC transporter ATP-binding protein [Niallia]MDK8641493.1 dipeptide ABC transporter ATP-binding protein [Niallia taxi]MED4039372.1 dipeptide ABC transporter ATP-binding protein [Niallia taxi]MED4055817.1 dipeptide ABC transporter ATP-binding protein [Niallia taxi]MED4121479.1 dipeptide ABC transporter ATP-binding protein [Niallia taxi]RVT57592.1 dipeptide ABC transporter ATP-binding protein [Niallia taxi]
MSLMEQDLLKKTEEDYILQAKNIKKYFPIKGGVLKHTVGHVKAVDDISLNVIRGETLGLVGESGSGKSTLGRVILRLLDPTEGSIQFEEQDITTLNNRKMRPIRKDMQIVFQDPFASLNGKMSVQELIEEPLLVQTKLNRREREEKAISLLEKVGLRADARTKYPHEFSGGQRQRISIARALALNPKFIVCDEPVSALDVSIQAQVLNLMADLQEEFNLTYLFIAHDLSVVKHISDRVAVMYLGRIAELAPKQGLYETPLHPYTQALLSAVPTTDVTKKREKIILKGDLPSPSNPPSGCAFRTRCPKAHERCAIVRPDLTEVSEGHFVACHLYSKED